MHYAGLDPAASYKVRVVYTGDMFQAKVRLVADESIEMHPYLAQAAGHEAAGVRLAPRGDQRRHARPDLARRERAAEATAAGARCPRSG